MAQFASVADLAAWLGITIASNDPKALLVLAGASAACQVYTRQTLARVANDQVTLVGNSSGVLELPERPAVSVSTATVNGYPVDFVLRKDQLLFGPAVEVWLGPDPDMGDWGGPTAAVAVTYTHGFDPIPDAVKTATLMIAARTWAEPTGEVPTSETIGQYAYTLGQILAEGLTDPERSLLSPYRRELTTTRT